MPGTAMPTAHSMPAWMSESKPPHLPSTRTGMTLTVRPTLAMPTPLPVAAPIRPSVCVPCQELFEAVGQSVLVSFAATKSPGSEASLSRPLPSLAVVNTPGESGLIMS